MVGGNLLAGHALVAYPVLCGETGIMSFMVGEADLGEDTLSAALEIELFDPGEEWFPIE